MFRHEDIVSLLAVVIDFSNLSIKQGKNCKGAQLTQKLPNMCLSSDMHLDGCTLTASAPNLDLMKKSTNIYT